MVDEVMRVQDEAVLLDNLYRTLAPKVQIRHCTRRRPRCPAVACPSLFSRLAFLAGSVTGGRLQNVDV
jgi:hypothetical protein